MSRRRRAGRWSSRSRAAPARRSPALPRGPPRLSAAPRPATPWPRSPAGRRVPPVLVVTSDDGTAAWVARLLGARVVADPGAGLGRRSPPRDGRARGPARPRSPSCSATCRRCARPTREALAGLPPRAAGRAPGARARRRRRHRHRAPRWPADPATWYAGVRPRLGRRARAAGRRPARPRPAPACGVDVDTAADLEPPGPGRRSADAGLHRRRPEPRGPVAAAAQRPLPPRGPRPHRPPGPAALPWARAGHRRAFRPRSPSPATCSRTTATCLPFGPEAFGTSGLRHLRPGQRLTVAVEGTGAACAVSRCAW